MEDVLLDTLGETKLSLVQENSYWPKLAHDVLCLVRSCRTYHIAKSHSQNT